MKIFAVQTYEPEDVFKLRIEDGSFFDLQEVGLYTDRETAELMARNYNELFNDEIPAQVVELEVNEPSIPPKKESRTDLSKYRGFTLRNSRLQSQK